MFTKKKNEAAILASAGRYVSKMFYKMAGTAENEMKFYVISASSVASS